MPVVILSCKESSQVYKRVVAKIKAMTPEERIRTLVRAGIYTEDGQLTPKYGGPRKGNKKHPEIAIR